MECFLLFTQKHRPRTKKEIVESELHGIGFDWDETLFEIERDAEFYQNMAQYAVSHSFTDLSIVPTEAQKRQIDAAIQAFGAEKNHGSAQQTVLKSAISEALGLDDAKKAAFQDKFNMHYPDYRATPEFLRSGKAHLIEGAKEMLIFLKKNQVPFFIASNSEQASVRAAVKEFLGDVLTDAEINTYVLGAAKVAVVSNDGDYKAGFPKKPDPQMLEHGFALIGAKPTPATRRQIYYIGNSINSDVVTALRAGVNPILFTGIEKASSDPAPGIKVINNAEREGTAEEVISRVRNPDGSYKRDENGKYIHQFHDVVTVTIEDELLQKKTSKSRYSIPVVNEHKDLLRMFEERLKSAEKRFFIG